MFKLLRKIFLKHDKYVITIKRNGVKYYYMGADSTWTPKFEGAKIYNDIPKFKWVSKYIHKIEKL